MYNFIITTTAARWKYFCHDISHPTWCGAATAFLGSEKYVVHDVVRDYLKSALRDFILIPGMFSNTV